MTAFRTMQGPAKPRHWATASRRLAVGVVALALLTGCTSIAGSPKAAGPSDSGKAQPGDTSYPSTDGTPRTQPGDTDPAASHDPGEQRRPTSSELIAAALADGEIDEPTSLLYRLWAQFDDPALPTEYRGAPEGYDLGLFSLLKRSVDDLPADVADQIARYLKRPTDPDSAFTAGGADDPPGFRAPSAVGFRAPSAASGSRQCADGWITQRVGGEVEDPETGKRVTLHEAPSFRIWACRDGGEARAQRQMDAIADIVASHTPAMMAAPPAGLGWPVADLTSADRANKDRADNSIDLYVLPAGLPAPTRDCGLVGICKERLLSSADSFGATLPAHPADAVGFGAASKPANGRSAYVLINSGLTSDPGLLEQTVVHELFHVLQYAHNGTLETHWFDEASATWSEIYYVPKKSADVHAVLLHNIQRSVEPLYSEEDDHGYDAYLWPLFMQQYGGASWVFNTWVHLEAAAPGSDASAVIAALNQGASVGTLFPEFVMRMLNADLQADPITPRFVNLDPNFPDDARPSMTMIKLRKGPKKQTLAIPSLGYDYLKVTVAKSTAEARRVRVSYKPNEGSRTMPTVEALVREADGDYRRTLLNVADGLPVCVSRDMLLAVSNPATAVDPPGTSKHAVSGTLTVEFDTDPDRAAELECRRLVGEIVITAHGNWELPSMSAGTERGDYSWIGKLTVRLDDPVGVDWFAEAEDTIIYPNAGSTWTLDGVSHFERCVAISIANPCTGEAVITDEYRAAVDVDLSDPWTSTSPDSYSIVEPDYVRVRVTDDGPILETVLPVEATRTVIEPLAEPKKERVTDHRTLACDTDQAADFGIGHWGGSSTRGLARNGYVPGTWNADHTQLSFHCQGEGVTVSGTLMPE